MINEKSALGDNHKFMSAQIIAPHAKRLQILGNDEIDKLYGLPHFTAKEQGKYFELSPLEQAAIEQLHSLKSRIYGILQLGYFKARHLFFVFKFSDIALDAKHIQQRYFPEFTLAEFEPTKVTRLKQQRLILELCNYRLCGEEERILLKNKAQQAVRVCGKPFYIFRELMS